MQISFDSLGSRLTKEDILRQVSEEAIYKRFCSKFPSRSFPSPFRKDKTPSFGFYKKDGRWLWKDLGGNGDSGDVFEFVRMHERTDFKGALQAIAEAFFITAEWSNSIIERRSFSPQAADEAKERKRSLIQVIRRDFRVREDDWWNRLLITPPIREYYLCRAAKEVWVDKKLYWFDKADNPIYYYLSPISQNIKCYRPLEKDKKRKWLSNQDPIKDIQGYWQAKIKEGPKKPLLLVKSMKEVMFFRAFHINAMANTGEHVHYHEDFIRHLRKYCSSILYLGDNDWPGRRAAIKLMQRHQVPITIIPLKWGAKDPTDLWLKDYRKSYDLLNIIYDYFQHSRRTNGAVQTPYKLHSSREKNEKRS